MFPNEEPKPNLPEKPMGDIFANAKPVSKTVNFDCKTHGQVQCEVHNGFGFSMDFSLPYCPKCENDKEADEIKNSRAAEEKRQTQHAKTQIVKNLKQAALPPRFEGKTFENYFPANDKAVNIKTTCQEYSEKFTENLYLGRGIILCGLAGTGKTHLAAAIANYIIKNHHRTVLFTTVIKAIRRVKETYGNTGETEQAAINLFVTPDLLLLDEIGVQFGSDTEKNIMFEIINERYEQMKPTIIISNLNYQGLQNYLGDRVLDRLKENGGMMLVFEWGSHRVNQKQEVSNG